MRLRLNTAQQRFAAFLWGVPAFYCLWAAHERLDSKLHNRQDFFGWLWRLFHTREWQKSTAQSSAFWLLATYIIYKLVSRLGYGWEMNVAVSLALDSATYVINKVWIWRQRDISVATSGGRNFAFWAIFTIFNGLMAWLLMSRVDLGTMHARYVLGVYGAAANPLIFLIRDRVVFSPMKLREVVAAASRQLGES